MVIKTFKPTLDNKYKTPNQLRRKHTHTNLKDETNKLKKQTKTLIAMCTDYLFRDEAAVGRSLALVASCAADVSFISLTISQRVQDRAS